MEYFINQLKNRLSEANPDEDLVKRILPDEKDAGEFQSRVVDEDGEIVKYAFIEEIVYHLCNRDTEKAKEIAKANSVSHRDFIGVVEITFDFVSWKNIPEAAFSLIDNFSLDEKKTTYGVLLYVRHLIGAENYKKSSEILRKYRGNIIPEQITQWGVRVFEQAMTFDPSEKKRDYTKAFKIREMFTLDTGVTSSLALEQYDYNMVRENFLTAARIAKVFDLDKTRMKRAAAKAFDVEFGKFKEKSEKGGYSNDITLSFDDPYLRSVDIVNEFSILEERRSGDAFSQVYYKEVSDAAFFFLKKLLSIPASDTINFFTQSFLSANIISDFYLNDVINIDRASASDQIIGEIVRNLDNTVFDLEQAELFYKPILKLYTTYSSHKYTLARIAYRLFEIFVKNDKIDLAYKSYVDFKYEKKEVIGTLMNRCLLYLQVNRIEEFESAINMFSIGDELGKNQEFMERIYSYFERSMRAKSYEIAQRLSSMFSIPQKRINSAAVELCRELLVREEDDEIIKIMYKFELTYKHLKKIFNEIYSIRVSSSWQKGNEFRKKFGITIIDIGFLRWFFSEVFRMKRFSHWFTGDEIEVEKKPDKK